MKRKILVYDFNGEEVIQTLEKDNIYDIKSEIKSLGYDPEDFELEVLIENGGVWRDGNGNAILEIINEEEIIEEKNAFNDADLFIEEYKDYLIGKKIKHLDGQKYEITDVVVDDSDEDNTTIKILGEFWNSDFQYLDVSDFKNFIDGEEIQDFSLVLQDEKIEEKIEEIINEEIKINKPEYKYYIKDSKLNKIVSGFEYKEDAEEEINKLTKYGNDNLILITKKFAAVQGPDPDINENWLTGSQDWSIIELALSTPDTTEDEKVKFINSYKEGKLKVVIKAKLIYFLGYSQKQLKDAFVFSDLEKCNLYIDYCTRCEMQLLKMLKDEL